jgi:phosphoserine aminotransferase
MDMFEQRIFNFAPGPATLPVEVLTKASQDLLHWQGLGAGVLEVSHRSPAFMQCYRDAIQNLRDLMAIPDHYKILFLQGGAIGHNAAIPMNLMGLGKKGPQADFVVSGMWTQKSLKEAAKYGNARLAASSEADHFYSIPPRASWDLSSDSAYVHICDNETVGGVEFSHPPQVGDIPLVADVSSNILSKVIDVNQYGVLFAGAQKNIGPAGLTIVIVREDLIGHALPMTPTVWDWKIQEANDSMINTPSTFSIYMAGEVFKWLKAKGGIVQMEQINRQKAQLLYSVIDQSQMYESRVHPDNRSKMNVTFYLKDETLNERFVSEAAAAGLIGIKGHKSVGGMRASIYNAMPLEGVQSLTKFMQAFEERL